MVVYLSPKVKKTIGINIQCFPREIVSFTFDEIKDVLNERREQCLKTFLDKDIDRTGHIHTTESDAIGITFLEFCQQDLEKKITLYYTTIVDLLAKDIKVEKFDDLFDES